MGPGTRSLLPDHLRATTTSLNASSPRPRPQQSPARGTGAGPSDLGSLC